MTSPLAAAPEPTPRTGPLLPHSAAAIRFAVLLAAVQLTLGSTLQMASIPVGLLISEIFFFFAPAWLAAQQMGFSAPRFLSFRRGSPWTVALGFLLGLANYPLAGGLEALVRAAVPARYSSAFDASFIFTSVTGFERALVIVSVGLVAPLCEETAFRGFIQRVFRIRKGDAFAVGATAVLFSIIHFDPIGFPARVELGVLFGLAALWTGSIWTSIAAHAANNLFATGLFFSLGEHRDDSHPPLMQLLQICLLGLMLTAPLLVALRRVAEREPPEPALERRSEPTHFGRRVLAWVLAGLAALGLFAALDWRGAELNYIDMTLPAAKIEKGVADPAQREAFEAAVQTLRRAARHGDAPIGAYLALRRWLAGRQQRGLTLSAAEVERALALLQAWRAAPPSEAKAAADLRAIAAG